PFVAHEMALRLRIETRPETIDDVLVFIDEDAAPGAAIRADGLVRFEGPNALLVKEVFTAQGPHRAEIDDVAGQLVVARLAGEDVDLRMVAAVDDLQLRRAADFPREADAARAHDAAIREQ